MGHLSKLERATIADLVDDLEVLHVERPSPVADVLRTLRTLAQIDTLICACPAERIDGWDLERFDCDSVEPHPRLRKLIADLLARSPRRFGWFDPACPEVTQRNVVVDLRQHVSELELRRSEWFTAVLAPMRWHDHQIERVLLSEGAELLGWFGVVHSTALTTRQRELWLAIAPALRRRLALERRLATAPLHNAALAAVFERIGFPALIVSARGRIAGANESGRALLESRRSDVVSALNAIRAGQPSNLPFQLSRLRVTSHDQEWLATLPATTAAERIAHSARLASIRLGLTPRQRDVLEQLVVGVTNHELAVALGISERAVEQHVSAIFDRAGVDSRSALVSTVLAGV